MKTFAAALIALALPLVAAAPTPGVLGNAFGNPSAPLTIEIFSDFQCPGCKTLHDNDLPQLMRDFVVPGKAYLVLRYFPLQGHPYGRVAAEFVCAAAHVGKYEKAANALWAQQQGWAVTGRVEDVINSALTPVEAKKVKALTKDPVVQAQIEADLTRGRAIPVMSTPTLLVSTRVKKYPISGLNNYSLLKSFLDGLLK